MASIRLPVGVDKGLWIWDAVGLELVVEDVEAVDRSFDSYCSKVVSELALRGLRMVRCGLVLRCWRGDERERSWRLCWQACMCLRRWLLE